MKLYDNATAPNPRRVRIFVAEKGLEIPLEAVDIQRKENLTPEFLEINPLGAVPVLETDAGEHIAESLAICRYLEALHPQPALFGTLPEEKGRVEMWIHRVEFEFVQRVFLCFQNTHDYMKGRMPQVPEFGELSRERAQKFLDLLDAQLATADFVAGDGFSMADISLLCGLEFGRVAGIRAADQHKAIARWHEQVAARPSAKA
ncbi:MAG: glutathione S-transferase family protein [Deltaproteobacteria bacterium]|nr:glutathione S-transferase family protein [Deltaproteobacteria bacterium]MBW2418971.1 glutathione S-transferase family protein [Deltaproteobacteria bacterium]